MAGVVALGLSACDDDEGTVGPAPGVESISVTPQQVELTVGSSAQLAAQVQTVGDASPTVTWESGDTDIATVDSEGNVTGVAAGQTTVTATASAGEDSRSAAAQVVVNEAPDDVTGVSVTPSQFTLGVGQSVTIEAAVDAREGVSTAVNWETSDESVAEITSSDDQSVTVEGVAEGNVTITATSQADPSQSASASGTVQQDAPPLVTISDVDNLGISTSFLGDPWGFNQTEEERFFAHFFDDEDYENYEFTSIDLGTLERFEEPGDPTALYGTVEVTVNYNIPHNQIDRLELMVDDTVTDYQEFSSSGDVSADAGGAVTFTLETHAIPPGQVTAPADSVPSILRPAFLNGDHTLGARAIAGSDTMTVTSSQEWNFRNPNLYLSGAAMYGPNLNTAKDAQGLTWERGSVAVAAVPVIYNPGQQIARTEFEITQNAGPTPTRVDSTPGDGFTAEFPDSIPTTAGGVATFQTINTDDLHSMLRLTGVDQAGEFITPADQDYTLLRIDNRPPDAGMLALKPPFATCETGVSGGVVDFDESVVNDSIPGSVNNWINDHYQFACGSTGGSDSGVGLLGTGPAFVNADGDTVSGGADFDPSGANDAYEVVQTQQDKLGNTSMTNAVTFGVDVEDPELAVIDSAGVQAFVGSGTPQQEHRFNAVEGKGLTHDSENGQEFDPLYNNVDELGNFAWYMEATDNGLAPAGFGDLDDPNPPFIDYVIGQTGGEILFGRLIRRHNGGGATNECIIGHDHPLGDCDDVPMEDSLPIGGDDEPQNGYYFYLAAAQDQAGNQSQAVSTPKYPSGPNATVSEETVMRRIIIDDELPFFADVSGSHSVGSLVGGTNLETSGAITGVVGDNLDLWFYQHFVGYTPPAQAAAEPHAAALDGDSIWLTYETGPPIAAFETDPTPPGHPHDRDNVIDQPFDENSHETLDTEADITATMPMFVSALEEVGDTHGPTLAATAPNTSVFSVTDAAGNNSTLSDVAIDTADVSGGTGFTTEDFLVWQMTGPQEEFTISVDQEEAGQFQIDVLVEAEVRVDDPSAGTPFDRVEFMITQADSVPSQPPEQSLGELSGGAQSVFQFPDAFNPTLFIGQDPNGPDIQDVDGLDGTGTDRIYTYRFEWNPTPEALRAMVGQLPKTRLEQDAQFEIRALGIGPEGSGALTHALEDGVNSGTVLTLTLKK